ncbi:MAG TPA: capsule assembly Wzi family protein [Terriglobia bacterium]|nr:capsule assembly Wzi family protein [Terriglobia bacterium]
MMLICAIATISVPGPAQTSPGSAGAAVPSVTPVRRPHRQVDWWGHHKKKDGQPVPDSTEYQNGLGLPLVKHMAGDQKAIWTSPFHVRLRDADWLVPLGGLAAALFVTDTDVSRHLSTDPTRISNSRTFSNMGAATLLGGAGGLYLLGKLRHNEHMRETGLLSGEAVIGSLLATTAIKSAAGRERPYVANAEGSFRQGGNSFPSEHATAAWATAGVLAHEYPGPLTRLFAYGLASAISASRVTGKEHFPSDVLVGSVLGYLIAQHVYHAHHDPAIWGGSWQMPSRDGDAERFRDPGHMGSPYVPLDSWVYPAFARLEARGYVQTAMLGMRPWTRLECARLVQEAADTQSAQENDRPVLDRLINSLEAEFAPDLVLLGGGRNLSAEFESVYTRFSGISGQPLTDGYHFGQTITNDFGRPYGEGFNSVTGVSGWASSGPFTAYLRGEYQHAPAGPTLPLSARQFIQSADYGLPLPPSQFSPSVDRFHAMDAYVAMNIEDWQLSFGKQSLWWGPAEGGSMMFSDNAAPMVMLRLSRVTPFKLPSIFGWLGPMRAELFVGRLSGQEFVYGAPTGLIGEWGKALSDQPMIHGERISFKPTPNLEFGFSSTALFAGAGVPFTAKTFLRSVFSTGNGTPGCFEISAVCPRIDPGDRRSGFDMTYRLPGLRNWVTFYTDSFTDDEISPVAYFDRSANSAGLYFPHLPKLPKIDLRLEGIYTDNPIGNATNNLCCGFYYSNTRYRNGYTNDGNLIGSWVGRDGQGEQAWLTYWHSPRSYLRFRYRHQQVSHQFVPYGGKVDDGGVEASFWLGRELSVSASLQYEKWDFPVLRPGPTSNFTSSVQFTYWPRWRVH